MTQQNLPVMSSDDQDPIGTQASQAHVTRVECSSHKRVSVALQATVETLYEK